MGFLRFLLAFFVITTHSGAPGVTHPLYASAFVLYVFYAISGYYITLTLNSKYAGPGGNRAYYINRFLRLYPIYFAILAISIPAVFLNENPTRAAWREIGAGDSLWIGLAHLTIFGQDAAHYFHVTGGGLAFTPEFKATVLPAWRLLVVPTCWSLAIDCIFYVIAPFVVRKGVSFRVALGVLSLGWWALILGLRAPIDPWIYRCFLGSLVIFLAGSLARTAHERCRPLVDRTVERLRSRPSLLVAALLAFFGLLTFWRMAGGNEIVPAVRYAVIPLFAVTLATLPFLFTLSGGASAWCRLDGWLGRVTYPVFIVHYPVIRLTGWSNPLAVMGASVAVSAVVLWVVEGIVKRLKVEAPRLRGESALIP